MAVAFGMRSDGTLGDAKRVMKIGVRAWFGRWFGLWMGLVMGFGIGGWVERVSAHSDMEELLDEANARLSEDPKKAAHYLYRGDLYRVAGEWKKAARDFEKARRLDPGLDRYWYCRGRLWHEAGSSGLAVEDLSRYLRAQPGDAQALLVRARAYRVLRRNVASMADYGAAITAFARPGPELFLEFAEVCEAHGDRARAVGVMELGLRRIGPAITLELRLVELLRKQGDHRRALGVVEAMIKQAPGDVELEKMRAEVSLALRRAVGDGEAGRARSRP